MFTEERHGPNKAMQILHPESQSNFTKGNLLKVKNYIEESLTKWVHRSANWSQGIKDNVHAEVIKVSFCAYHFVGTTQEAKGPLIDWNWL